VSQIKKVLGRSTEDSQGNETEDFHGLFIFEFDDHGRISSHIIEHVEEGNNWEKTATFISVTDWLLGRAWRNQQEPGVPGLAFCELRGRDVPSGGRRDVKG
jgi:protein up-regulated during meiosis